MTKPLNVPIFYDESLGPKTKNCKFTFLLKCKNMVCLCGLVDICSCFTTG